MPWLLSTFVIKALVYNTATLPLACRNLLQFGSSAIFERYIVLPFRKGTVTVRGFSDQFCSVELRYGVYKVLFPLPIHGLANEGF